MCGEERMNVKSLLQVSVVGLVGSLAVTAVAEDRQRVAPWNVSPMGGTGGDGLSAPAALDAPQALVNVSIPSVYVPITPCRIVDTRQIGGAFGAGQQMGFWAWAEGADNYLPFGGNPTNCGIPGEATAVHVNFTIVSPKGNGFLRAWPNSLLEPNATLFAWDAGFGAANAATIPICSDGTTGNDYNTQCVNPDLSQPGTTIDFLVKIYSDFAEELVIDAFGYYTAAP
jgi:hypothetical protein